MSSLYYYDSEGYARPTKKLPQNVPYDTWAPQMWQQFNNLASNFKDTPSFSTQVHSLIDQIPCPECKTDGLSYVKTNPPEIVRDKSQAQQWVSSYHKHVDQVAAKKPGWGYYAQGGFPSQNVINLPQGQLPPGIDASQLPPGIDYSQMKSGFTPWREGHGFYLAPIDVSTLAGKPGASGAEGGAGGAGGGETTSSTGGKTFGPGGGGSASGYGRDLITDPWYTTMWAELHEYAYDFNPATFASDVRNQIEQIPLENERCYINSQEFMRNNPPEYVWNRDQAMYWMCRFHNHASLDAGNGLVDCDVDPEGYGYVSGHDDYARDFFYGGGSRGGGGGQRGGGSRGGRRKRGGKGRGGGMRGGGQMGQGYNEPPAIVPGQPGQPGMPGAPGQPGIGGSGGAGGSASGGQGGAGGAGGIGGHGYAQGGFKPGGGPTNIVGSPETGQIGQFPGGSGPIQIKPPDPGIDAGPEGGGGGGGGEVGHPGAPPGIGRANPGAPGPGGGGGGGGGYYYEGSTGQGPPPPFDPNAEPGQPGQPGPGGGGGGGGGTHGGAGGAGGWGYYDDYGNFYMSKAQVKASGWPQCSQCLSHGRTLRDCSLLGDCRGPWSDGAKPEDLKMEQLRHSRISIA